MWKLRSAFVFASQLHEAPGGTIFPIMWKVATSLPWDVELPEIKSDLLVSVLQFYYTLQI